jgi:exodeoxyribonuclease V beta subunit
MEEAMKGSNYNLQYMIYTVAVKRWLEKRIENFNYDSHFGGIIYVFLRGVREGYDTGIFTTKPQTDKIEGLEKLLSNK